jgi:CBS domain-containing protein
VLAMKVADLMDPSPATLRPSDSIEEATRLFADPKINPIPIVNGQKKLIGILAISDLTKLYSVSIRHSLDNTQADENIENFIKDFEKEFVVVTKFRTRTWMIVSILFAVIGFLIAMFFIIRVNF